jgi:flavin reductase (DIM6/NTAB) family NADH-FMN oxidoreductase RutF
MAVTAEEFKNVMARVASAVTIVTAKSAAGPIGLTVSAFMSVSADPAIVLVAIDKATSSVTPMLDAVGFTVNIMPEGADDEAMLFATHGADKFGESDWSDAGTPAAGPVLANALAYLECITVNRHESGDHWVLYGELNAATIADADALPLVWHDRAYAKLVK